MISSNDLRLRRKLRQRFKLSKVARDAYRLTIHRTNCNMYAQVIDMKTGKTLVSASTLSPEAEKVKNGGNKEAAVLVGKLVAEKATKAGIKNVVFDRSGFLYHGRVKALADSARENGLVF